MTDFLRDEVWAGFEGQSTLRAAVVKNYDKMMQRPSAQAQKRNRFPNDTKCSVNERGIERRPSPSYVSIVSPPDDFESKSRFRVTLRHVWLVTWLGIAAIFFSKALFSRDQSLAAVRTTPISAKSSPKFKAIETIRPGDRVMGSSNDDKLAVATQVDQSTWRLLRLRGELRWSDGTLDDINVETFQPLGWIVKNNAYVGAEVPLPLELVEMGLPADLAARVIASERCPKISSGSGRVVLTTVNHLNADIYELSLVSEAGRVETVRPTGLHKFYRASDGEWISAKDLTHGDLLEGINGPIVVESVVKVPGVQRVYNMTVEGEHVYRVSTLGALAHNNGCGGALPSPTGPVADHHVFPQQHKGFFESKGIDIGKYTVTLDHNTSHLKGIHGNGNLGQMPGKWNDKWTDFITKNPSASTKEVYQFGGRLMDDFGINNLPIHPYGQ